MELKESQIEEIVRRVVSSLQAQGVVPAAPPSTQAPRKVAQEVRPSPVRGPGIFDDIEAAIEAAVQAQKEWVRLPLEKRQAVVQAMRQAAKAHAEELARMAVEETQMGRVDHKRIKNETAADLTPGFEDLETEVLSGEKGITLIERVPYGVILAITPTTNPTSTIINNALTMTIAGNSVVFAPHPRAQWCSLQTMVYLNQAIEEAGGPMNLLTACREATLRVVAQALKSPKIAAVCATGGAGVVRAALESGKKAFAAGPGNPPVLVDETADIEKAGRDIVSGAAFDNNLPCVAEKIIIVVQSVADALIQALIRHGAHWLQPAEAQKVTQLVVQNGEINKDYIGKDPEVILRAAGLPVPSRKVEILVFEADLNHPLVQHEQLMPVIPLLRVRNFEEGVQAAVGVEHRFLHTAVIHSNDLRRISRFAEAIGTTIFIANAPSYAWAGIEGEGWQTLTVTGPTGEGITRPRTFTRTRHIVLGGGVMTFKRSA